jgi:plastocyanin
MYEVLLQGTMQPIIVISTLVILCIVLLMTAGCTGTTSSSSNTTTSAPVSGTTITGSTPESTSQPSAIGQTTQVTLVSVNYAFDKTSITVPAGSHVQLTLDNQDTGIPHNVAIYTSAAASTVIFKGEVITGPKKITYTFDAPTTPGTYYFRCDIHPSMNGAFIVQ